MFAFGSVPFRFASFAFCLLFCFPFFFVCSPHPPPFSFSHAFSLPVPCPFPGMFLTDLTFIDTGNPDKLQPVGEEHQQSSEPLINFAKLRKTAAVIKNIQVCACCSVFRYW